MFFKRKQTLGSVVAVVLGGGILKDGVTPSQESYSRAKSAKALARAHPGMTIIVSGDGSPADTSRTTTEAHAMRRVLLRDGVSPRCIWIEDDSIDTIGNAVLVAARYLFDAAPRTLYVVTSPFHLERAVITFKYVLGPQWNIVGHPTNPAANDLERAAKEPGGLQWTHGFFAGVEPGDIHSIVVKLRVEGKKQYAQLRWLKRTERKLQRRRRRRAA
ncbi:MAG: YdcF family protein [Terriglobales bacterium]